MISMKCFKPMALTQAKGLLTQTLDLFVYIFFKSTLGMPKEKPQKIYKYVSVVTFLCYFLF